MMIAPKVKAVSSLGNLTCVVLSQKAALIEAADRLCRMPRNGYEEHPCSIYAGKLGFLLFLSAQVFALKSTARWKFASVQRMKKELFNWADPHDWLCCKRPNRQVAATTCRRHLERIMNLAEQSCASGFTQIR
jgi:hypothetical protein